MFKTILNVLWHIAVLPLVIVYIIGVFAWRMLMPTCLLLWFMIFEPQREQSTVGSKSIFNRKIGSRKV